MPQEQQFDPVAELKKSYPKIAGESDERIHQYLSVPENFRRSFPKYKNLDDVTIKENMARIGKPPVSTAPPDPMKQAQAKVKDIIPKEAGEEARDPYSLERLAKSDSAVRGLMQAEQWRPRWDRPDQILQDPTWYGRSARYAGGELIGGTKAGIGVILGGYKVLHDLAAIFDPFEGMQHGRTVADPYKQLGRDFSAIKDVGTAAWDLIRHFPEADADPEAFGNTLINAAMIVDGGIKSGKSFAEMLKIDPREAARVANNANKGAPSRFFRRKAFEDAYVHTKGLKVAKEVGKASKAIREEVELHASGLASQIDTAIPSGVIDATAEAQLIRQEFADAVKFPEKANPTLVTMVKAADAAPGMWSWEKVRQLRSAIGRSMGKVSGPQSVVLTRIYKDLTRKLSGVATQYGMEDSWKHYNELESKASHQFADLIDDVHNAQSGKEVAAKLAKDDALTKELADNLQKYGLDSKDVMKFSKDAARITKQQRGWKGTLFRMAYGSPVGVPVMLGARLATGSWLGGVAAGAIAGYASNYLINMARALKLSPEVIDDILSQRELPSPKPVSRGVFPQAPPPTEPPPTGPAPVPTGPTPGAPPSPAPGVPPTAALPSPPGTTPPALPAPAPEPAAPAAPETPTRVPEGVHGTGKIARGAKARERAARLRAEGGPTAAGGGGLEISGGDVARKAQEAQEAERRAGAPDTSLAHTPVPEMEEALRGLMPKVFDRLQQARKAGKFAEQDYEHYLREVLLRAYEQRAEKTMPKPQQEHTLIDFASGRSPMADDPRAQLPPHVEELGRKLGITRFFLGAESSPTSRGWNVGHVWREEMINWYKKYGKAPVSSRPYSHEESQLLADKQIEVWLDEIKGLRNEDKVAVMDSLKKGEDTIFLSPKVKGHSTAVHEVLHTLTNKELRGDLSGPPVGADEIHQLFSDQKNRAVRGESVNIENLDWLSRRQEYFTELLTQYLLKNLKEGSKSHQLAEAILRSSDNPVVRNLIGASLGAVIAYHIAQFMQGEKKGS